VLAVSSEQQIRLSSTPTRIAIALAEPVPDTGKREGESGQHVLLVLEGLSAALTPGISYDIFLGRATDPQPSHDNPGYAGTLNFYSITGPRSSDPPAVSFDVTTVLARLRSNGASKGPLAVTFIPNAPPPPGSEPIVGRLKLIIP
jgi:hypothetical protein